MVYFQVSQIHIPLFFCIVSIVEHVPLFVLFLIICFHCLNIDRVFWLQFVRNIFRRFVLFRLSRLLPKTSHVHARLFRCCLLSCPFRRLFSFSKWLLSFNWRGLSFLSFLRFDLRLFLLGFFIFRRHRIENSCRSVLFFLVISGCKVENVESFNFVLQKPPSWYLIRLMRCPPMFLERLNDPFDQVKGNVKFRILLLSFFVWLVIKKLPILLAHFIADISLISSLSNQSLLILEPNTHGIQGSELIFTSINLSNIRQHGMYFLK